MRSGALLHGLVALAAIVATACSGPVPDAVPSSTAPAAASRVVDLGHALSATDPSWAGLPDFSRTVLATFAKQGYAAGKIEVAEHFGTHVDAPSHFAESGLSVDRIPADRLVRPGVCINIAAKVAGNEDYALSVEDIVAFESANGRIAADTIVLVATGWDSRWPDRTRYMNERDGVKHFPGLSQEAATLLARDRRAAAIGVDTPSIDIGPSAAFEAHHATMPLGAYHIENAAGLTSLPATGFTVVVAPIKIKDGSGGPARVFALLNK